MCARSASIEHARRATRSNNMAITATAEPGLFSDTHLRSWNRYKTTGGGGRAASAGYASSLTHLDKHPLKGIQMECHWLAGRPAVDRSWPSQVQLVECSHPVSDDGKHRFISRSQFTRY